MSRTHQFPVQVKSTTDEDGNSRPLAVYWEDEPYPVEVIRRRDQELARGSIGGGNYFMVQACGKEVGCYITEVMIIGSLKYKRGKVRCYGTQSICKVLCETDTEGKVAPIALFWQDGRRFEIDKVTEVRRAVSMKAGGTGLRYTCVIRKRQVFLYYEEPRWFVEAK